MKVSEFRSMSVSEVRQSLAERQEEFSNLRFQLVTNQLTSPISVRRVRREIAVLKTILREHELGLHALGAHQGEGGPTAASEAEKGEEDG